MYGYLIGIVTEIDPNSIILEVNNIGYQINVSNPYYYKLKEKYKVYLYNNVKEDEYSLYGFKDREEKNLFLKLISVKGLGPKMALPIIALSNTSSLAEAIDQENITYLKKFPKIGDKVARQMVLDLKGKIFSDNLFTTLTVQDDNTDEELLLVLEGLGYKKADVRKILPKVNKDNSLELQIKEALKLLLK